MFFLFSCSQEREKGFFTESEIAWLVYEEGDTIPFFSEQLGTVQFHVTEKTEYSRVSKEFPIEAEVTLKSLKHDFLLKIYLLKDSRDFKKYVRLNHVYRSLDLLSPEPKWEMDHKVFRDVFEIAEDTTRNGLKIHNARFNKDHGFLKIVDYQGNALYRTSIDDGELSAIVTEK